MKHCCIGVLAHVDAGKTTLSEALLYRAGAIRRLGRVDHQDAFLDTDAMERQRGITIFSKQAVLELGSVRVTLLDTPGHVDFSAEMERTLQVLDCAVLVISGTDGVQGHTRTLWELLERYHVPTFLFINKMDLAGTDRDALLAHLKEKLDGGCVDFGDSETLAEEDGGRAVPGINRHRRLLGGGQHPEKRDRLSPGAAAGGGRPALRRGALCPPAGVPGGLRRQGIQNHPGFTGRTANAPEAHRRHTAGQGCSYRQRGRYSLAGKGRPAPAVFRGQISVLG